MAIAGKGGKLAIGASDPIKVVGIKSWSLDLSLDTLETTELGSDWKTYISGLKEWTASCDGDYDVQTVDSIQNTLQEAYLNGTEVEASFFVDDTHSYAGKAIISSLSVEDPVDDVVNISIEFTGNGAVSFS